MTNDTKQQISGNKIKNKTKNTNLVLTITVVPRLLLLLFNFQTQGMNENELLNLTDTKLHLEKKLSREEKKIFDAIARLEK